MVYIKKFSQIDKEDIKFAGGKGANLGEMVKVGLPIPPGFIVGTNAYFDFLEKNNLKRKIEQILSKDLENPETLLAVSAQVVAEFESIPVPEAIVKEVKAAYREIKKVKVAVRSSATAEDLPKASFAGQQETFLNVKGEAELINKLRSCWASLFTPRAIFYRRENNFDHLKIGLAVIVQKMVQSEVSGVMFTLDPVSVDRTTIVIEAGFGLGELIVGGKITPDEYKVRKQDLQILEKKIATQNFQLVDVKGKNLEIKVSPKFASSQKLNDGQILELSKLGLLIEKHYYFPQDIEWAEDGGKIHILQTRPVTVLGEKLKVSNNEKVLELKLVLEGTPASPGIAAGPVKILKSAAEIGKIARGDILVTTMTNPDFVPAMKKAVAVVTDRGGRTSHAAIVSRELGKPAVVGTEKATKILKNSQIVTVDGKKGKIFLGAPKTNGKVLSYEQKPQVKQKLPPTVTKIYVNLAEPERAEEVAKLDVDGVGLLRAEFMIAEIGIHPKLAINKGKRGEFVKKLTNGLITFAESFTPRPVIYRASDFKTNEYRNLSGGEIFEPVETNPMIGFRGALRFLTQPEVFEMELEAIKRVYRYGFENLKLMVPFVRTPDELAKVKSIVAGAGLYNLPDFALWMMVEVPSNVLLLPKFLEVGIDGVSIGSNDLTMLILGVDRDSEQLAQIFKETDPAVMVAMEKVIKTCKAAGVPCSICGQAPSVFDDLVKKLVIWGITSISVAPDSVERVRQLVADTERELVLEGFDQNYQNREINLHGTLT